MQKFGFGLCESVVLHINPRDSPNLDLSPEFSFYARTPFTRESATW